MSGASMLQCAPYIKTLCQSIHSWKDHPGASSRQGCATDSSDASSTQGNKQGKSKKKKKKQERKNKQPSDGHGSGTSSWLPPLENWDSGGMVLPYGWEAARDKEDKQYFINHLNKTTTYEDPRKDFQEEPPQPREYELTRDTEMGFGFVAGSEKPVIVRFVTEGGPSADLLLPGDQILTINGQDVKTAPRDHVIQLVRSCKDKVTLTVTQPPLDNSARKSAMLSAAKKQRLKNNPSRVRFAESVDINGSPSSSPSNFNSSESTTPFMPNVLKVFLENGQTKSFKYDSSTTVGDVLDSLHQKLGIKCPEHFSLVVEHVKSLRRNKLTILDPKEALSMIAARPGAQHLRCLYRVTFVPRDAYNLLRKDSMAFEYLYLQVNSPVWCTQFTSHQRSHSTPLRYNTVVPLDVGCTMCSKLESSNGMINVVNEIQECGICLSKIPFEKTGRKQQHHIPSSSCISSISSKVFCMLSSALTHCNSFIVSVYASGVSYFSSGLLNLLLLHGIQKPACLFKWSIALLCFLPTHHCMVKSASSSLIFTSSVPQKQIYLSLYYMQFSERSHAKDFSTWALLRQKDDEPKPIKEKPDKWNFLTDISKSKLSVESLKKWTPSKETFENVKPLSKVIEKSKFLTNNINKADKIDIKNLKSNLNKFSGVKLSPERKEEIRSFWEDMKKGNVQKSLSPFSLTNKITAYKIDINNLKSKLNKFSGVKLSPERKDEIKSFWEDMKKGNVQRSLSHFSLRNKITSESLQNWKLITNVEQWKYYWKNLKVKKDIHKITSNDSIEDKVNGKSSIDNKSKIIQPENGEKFKTTVHSHEIIRNVNKVNEITSKDSLVEKISSKTLTENVNKIIPSENVDKLKTYFQKNEIIGAKPITEKKSLKERFKPSLSKVGKGLWTHRKYLYWLYHFSFILSIYRSVKKFIKWGIGLTLGTILYRNSDLVAKNIDKLKSFGQFLLKRSLIRKIVLLTKKIFRFNLFVNLFKRIFKKK